MTLLASVMLLASACTGKQAKRLLLDWNLRTSVRKWMASRQTCLFWRIRMVWKFVLRISVDVLYQ